MDYEQKAIADVTEAFKAGWEKAGREGCVEEKLASAWINHLGIHPDRVQHYANALMDYTAGRQGEPDPADFQEPVVLPVQLKANRFNKG